MADCPGSPDPDSVLPPPPPPPLEESAPAVIEVEGAVGVEAEEEEPILSTDNDPPPPSSVSPPPPTWQPPLPPGPPPARTESDVPPPPPAEEEVAEEIGAAPSVVVPPVIISPPSPAPQPSPSASPAPSTPDVVRPSPQVVPSPSPAPSTPDTGRTPQAAPSLSPSPAIGVSAPASGTVTPVPSARPVLAPSSTPSPAPTNGASAPVVRPTAITAKPGSSYQSLASFGDDGPPAGTSGLFNPPSRKDIVSPATTSASASSSSAPRSTVQTPRLNRSGSIDRLTGRVPLPPSTASPLKVGWLKKEGEGVLGGHKKRWCVLGAKTLDFFKEITDEKSQGTIILPGASVFVEDKLEFHLLPVRATKKISFRCESEFDRNVWVKMLNELVMVPESLLEHVFDADSYADWTTSEVHDILLPSLTRLLSKVGTMSSIWGVGDGCNVGVLLSGFLTKMGERVKNFKRRYFVLVGSVLLYFETEESYMLTDAGGAAPPPPPPAGPKQTVAPVVGQGAPTAPSIVKGVSLHPTPSASSSKGSHGKEVLASLARSHLRTQRRSITAVDLQNHHLIRRQSQYVSFGSSGSASSLADEAKRQLSLQKKALKGEGKPALGMIPLRGCTVSLEPLNSRPYGLSVQTRDRKYFLFADNEDELRAWFYMISLIVQSLPIQRFMKNLLETEIANGEGTGIPRAGAGSGSMSTGAGGTSAKVPPLLSDPDFLLLKKQLAVTLLDPTGVRFLHNYWLERQSFHEPRTYPIIFPLESPLALVTDHGAKFFEGLVVDEAGDRGENAMHLPLHYLHFWLDCENWMNLRAPARVDGGGEPNPFATAQDPSCVQSCVPLAESYRQQRAEEIIDKYLSHGAAYPVYLDRVILADIFSQCLRGPNSPNKIAPSHTLFHTAQELVTEMIAIEIFPRYLKSKSGWGYLTAIAAKYDESLIFCRAENLVEALLARAYEPETYADLTTEEKEDEEDDRIKSFRNLVTCSANHTDELALQCAEQFALLPNTDPCKLIYHNYLYALQRLREYHALFSDGAATPGPNQPPIAIAFRQTHAAKTFYHEFLVPGAPFAICIPYKLIRDLRALLGSASPRRQFLFMNIEHCLLTELSFAFQESKVKVRRQVSSQKAPTKKISVNPSTGVSDRKSIARRAPVNTQTGLESVAEVESAATAAPTPMVVDTDPLDVPFNMVLGVPALFSHFRRWTVNCRHINPQYLWDQVTLISRIFDYRHLADPKVMMAYARQVYSQYLSESAPHKINLSRSTNDQFKVGISQASPGPHVFLPVLRELYKNLEHLYTHTYRTLEVNRVAFSYLQEDFGLFMRHEICVTQGKRDFNFDANVSLLTNSKNASTWFDILDYTGAGTKDIDDSLANLSSHQALWCAYFRQFLTERFCAENAAFYVEADDYRRCPGPAYRVLRAKRLYERYISETAQLQVNVPSWVARELTTILARDGGGAGAIVPPRAASLASARPSSAATHGDRTDLNASSPLLYIAAQREIFLLILNNNIGDFRSSDSYKEYQKVCQARL